MALGVAGSMWRSRRYIAYGSLATLIPALAVVLAILGAARTAG